MDSAAEDIMGHAQNFAKANPNLANFGNKLSPHFQRGLNAYNTFVAINWRPVFLTLLIISIMVIIFMFYEGVKTSSASIIVTSITLVIIVGAEMGLCASGHSNIAYLVMMLAIVILGLECWWISKS